MLIPANDRLSKEDFNLFFTKLIDYFGKEFGASFDVARHAYWKKVQHIPVSKLSQALETIFSKAPTVSNFPSAEELVDICGVRNTSINVRKVRNQSTNDLAKLHQLSMVPKLIALGFSVSEIETFIAEGKNLSAILAEHQMKQRHINYQSIAQSVKKDWAIE